MKIISKIILWSIGIASVILNLILAAILGGLVDGLEKEKSISSKECSEIIIKKLKSI